MGNHALISHLAPDQRKSSLRNRRGAILVLVAVFLVGLMSLLALVVDGGAVTHQRRLAQAAADAGAIAGAIEIYRQRPESVFVTARGETQRNGFTHGAGGVTVTVTNPTTSGNFVGPNFVEVTITKDMPLSFGGLINWPSFTVHGRAVAGLGPALACIILTEPIAPSALAASSNASVTAQDCAIAVNSASNAAINLSSNATVSATSVAVTGGPATKPADVTGDYVSGSPPMADPLAYLTMPAVGACNGAYGAYANYGGASLSPGVYCGGIGIDHSTVTFQPGLYILAGGGLDFKHATVNGTGVTFINTNAPSANGGASYQPFDMDVNSNVRLSSCTTYDATLCPFPGILFWQDPAASPALDPGGNVWVNTLGSSAAATFNGTVYLPTQAVGAKSHSPITINGGLVALRLDIKTGQEQIVVTGASAGEYFALKRATIVE
jgi:hypothetical protein